MEQIDAQVMVPVYLWNQIRGGDVEEVAGREGYQESGVEFERHRVGEDSTNQEGQ